MDANCFCCQFSLNTAGIIIGVYEIVQYTLLFFFALHFFKGERNACHWQWVINVATRLERFWWGRVMGVAHGTVDILNWFFLSFLNQLWIKSFPELHVSVMCNKKTQVKSTWIQSDSTSQIPIKHLFIGTNYGAITIKASLVATRECNSTLH